MSSSGSGASSEPDLQYPVGRFQPPAQITAEDRVAWMAEVEALPKHLKQAIAGLTETQLDTPYRPGGWTVRQVVHHLADSHINSYVRFRLAFTEDAPTIKPYNEAAWADLADAKIARAEVSLHLLEALHARWIMLLRSFKSADMARTFVHPERGAMSLDQALGLYAWHGRHHVAHITNLRKSQGW
jgi:hypothetical protein